MKVEIEDTYQKMKPPFTLGRLRPRIRANSRTLGKPRVYRMEYRKSTP